MNEGRKRGIIGLLALICALVALISLVIGQFFIDPRDLLRLFASSLRGVESGLDGRVAVVFWQIRLPRVLAGLLIGSGLSVAGAVYQGIFRNPMASPDVLGVSQGAALGASAAILLGLPLLMVNGLAFFLGLATMLLSLLIAGRSRGDRSISLILSGMMIGWLCNAGVSLVKLLADPTDALPAITYWLMGSLASIRISDIWFLLPCVALGMLPLLLLRWKINVLTLGDREALSLGIHPGRYRALVIVCATLMTAACVSVSGMIGWVGLVVPHIARRLVGDDYRYLLPASALVGAAYLLAVDDFARMLASIEIPIGILTAFIGAPFFIYLLLRRER